MSNDNDVPVPFQRGRGGERRLPEGNLVVLRTTIRRNRVGTSRSTRWDRREGKNGGAGGPLLRMTCGASWATDVYAARRDIRPICDAYTRWRYIVEIRRHELMNYNYEHNLVPFCSRPVHACRTAGAVDKLKMPCPITGSYATYTDMQ